MGTHRPHLPWVYPREFFDKVAEDVPEAVHKQWPADVPHIGFHDCAEMSHAYFGSDGYGTAFSDSDFSGHQSLMRRAYYGCLGYADNLIGHALDMLADRGVEDSTVVSFVGGELLASAHVCSSTLGRWPTLYTALFARGSLVIPSSLADHGWHLGEHDMYVSHTNPTMNAYPLDCVLRLQGTPANRFAGGAR
jgi:hypothetical protein